jgi:hypothetical protein
VEPRPEATRPGRPMLPARCLYCGSDNRDGFHFCRKCGRAPEPGKPVGSDPATAGGPAGPTRPRPAPATGPRRAPAAAPATPPAISGGDPEVRRFLAMDPFASFDLLALNRLPLERMARDARAGDRALLRRLQQRAQLLLSRVENDTGLSIEVGGIVREILRQWYVDGGPAAGAAGDAGAGSRGWAGLFAESRVPGGAHRPRLADRIYWLSRGQAGPEGDGRVRFFGRSGAEAASPTQPPGGELELELEAAQALLDDLAAFPRGRALTVPLPRVTALAGGHGVRSLNIALSRFLTPEDHVALIALDPALTPGLPKVRLRLGGEPGGESDGRYVLEIVPTLEEPGPVAPEPRVAGGAAFAWGAEPLDGSAWEATLARLRDTGRRLPTPPRETFRKLASYRSLRSSIVEDPAVLELYRQVRWKDRPVGLGLLAELLAASELAPEVETDGQYLETELDELAETHETGEVEPGRWRISGSREVRRSADPARGVVYRVDESVGPTATG